MTEAQGRARYVRGDYFAPLRLHSYAHQLAAILEANPSTVLEVGVGSGYVRQSLSLLGYSVRTLDVQASLEPDLVGNVTAIPIGDEAFEVVSCCQVLEHLPYHDVADALCELRRVAARRVVISLPDVSRLVCSIQIPKLGRRQLSLLQNRGLQPMPPERRDIGHQWEIGFAGYPLRRLLTSFKEAGLRCERTWRVPELAWHRFFVLMPE